MMQSGAFERLRLRFLWKELSTKLSVKLIKLQQKHSQQFVFKSTILKALMTSFMIVQYSLML